MGESKSKYQPDLDGVAETLLWPLYNRAAEARRNDARLHDPKAIEICDAVDYPFAENFGAPDQIHSLRALCIDSEIKQFLSIYPTATVVALGDGLETQFWRVDNGQMKWLAVDLPQSIDLRRRFMPDSDRHRNLACSALDLRWMDELDTPDVIITAQGLLMYFAPEEVRRLIGGCAARFPGCRMLFDVIPRWFAANTLNGYQKTRTYRTPPMPWGLDVNQLAEIQSFHPNIAEVRELDFGRGRGYFYGFGLPILMRLPFLGNRRTSFVMVRFGETAAGRSTAAVAR